MSYIYRNGTARAIARVTNAAARPITRNPEHGYGIERGVRETSPAAAMAASMISSSALAAPARAQGLPSLGRRASSFAVVCGTGKKIKTDKPFGIGGGLTVDHDASGRKVKVSLFVRSFFLAFFLSF